MQTFCNLEFGGRHEVWNRDIDRQTPRWLMHRLSIGSGIPLADTYQTTLCSYRLRLYPRHHETGIQQWILPLEMWHRKHMGHGLQYCPACLAEDDIPYFRKRWRVALYTFCIRHNVMVHDRCPECGAGVAFHRIEQGHYGSADDSPLAVCHRCGFDLRQAPLVAPVTYEDSSYQTMLGALSTIDGRADQRFDVGFFSVLHQLCKIILSEDKHTKLREYLISRVGAEDVPLEPGMNWVEERLLHERHHVIQLGMWLMADPAKRIVNAWREKVVRYNVLKRDFERMPHWYREVVERCSDWRAG